MAGLPGGHGAAMIHAIARALARGAYNGRTMATHGVAGTGEGTASGGRQALPRVVVGAVGWEHRAWKGELYPAGLPPEWRLACYANEFEALWVPAGAWGTRPAARAARWAADLPEGFDLVVELPEAALAMGRAVDRRAWWRALEALAPWLRAVVVPRPRDAAEEAARVRLARRWPVRHLAPVGESAAPGEVWRPGAAVPGGSAIGLVRLEGREAAPRALRALIEAFLAQAPPVAETHLFFDAPGGVAVGTLEAAEIICRLLGAGLVDRPAGGADTDPSCREAPP